MRSFLVLLLGVEEGRTVYCIFFEEGLIAEVGKFLHARICSKKYFPSIYQEKIFSPDSLPNQKNGHYEETVF